MINIEVYQKYIGERIQQLGLPQQPSLLYDPIRYFLDLSGKKMRPILTLMGCELFNPDYTKATNAALAVELFHNFSLIHDDIMDEAPLRRNSETVHEKWNTNIGILSGDAVLVLAYQKIASYPPNILAQLLPIFNETALKVCEGQQYDMDFETQLNVSVDDYIEMIKNKTAVLLGCSLQMGAIIGEASDNDAKELYNFGVNLGLAFQLQDDILDVYADKNKFGKQVGGDIIANKKTYLLIRAFEDANERQTQNLNNLLIETDLVSKVKGVKALYSELEIKAKAEIKLNEFYKIALKNLDAINISNTKKEPLLKLAHFLMKREN